MSRPSVTVEAFSPQEGTLANNPVLFLTKVFVYFLQNLFRDMPRESGMHWEPEEETTQIIITSQKPRLESIEKTPHITCILGAGRMSGITLDQMLSTSMKTGSRTHTDLMPFTMSYHCQAKEGLVASNIAWQAGYHTNILRRIIMKGGGIHHVSPSWDMSAESPPTAYTGPLANVELVSVVVTIPFYWQPQWNITEPAHLWRRLRVQLSVLEGRSYFTRAQREGIREPHLLGVPVRTVQLDEPRKVAFTQIVLETSLEEKE